MVESGQRDPSGRLYQGVQCFVVNFQNTVYTTQLNLQSPEISGLLLFHIITSNTAPSHTHILPHQCGQLRGD